MREIIRNLTVETSMPRSGRDPERGPINPYFVGAGAAIPPPSIGEDPSRVDHLAPFRLDDEVRPCRQVARAKAARNMVPGEESRRRRECQRPRPWTARCVILPLPGGGYGVRFKNPCGGGEGWGGFWLHPIDRIWRDRIGPSFPSHLAAKRAANASPCPPGFAQQEQVA